VKPARAALARLPRNKRNEHSRTKVEQFFDLPAICAVFLVVGLGAWASLMYVRHERAAGSASNQLRRIDEEARKAGWTKGSNGAWSIPPDGKTNARVSKNNPAEPTTDH
jgi:hypothetical protein